MKRLIACTIRLGLKYNFVLANRLEYA